MIKATSDSVKRGDTVRVLPGCLGRRAGRSALVVEAGAKRLLLLWSTGGRQKSYYYHHFELVPPVQSFEIGDRVLHTVSKEKGVVVENYALNSIVEYDRGITASASNVNLRKIK